MTFAELGLSKPILESIAAIGFESPTGIQEQTIPVLLEKETDMIALAQTGTGKTAAFGIPMLEKIDVNINKPQYLVVCPTRELCSQIVNEINLYGKQLNNLKVVAVYGGVSIDKQIGDIKRGAQIVVATPGRLIDLLNRGKLNLDAIKCVVLDEADEMLNMGFKEDIEEILNSTPDQRKIWLFSATMPEDISMIAKTYMEKPVEISIGRKNATSENISHELYSTNERTRYEALKRILDFNPGIYSIIFCRTKLDTQDLAEKLVVDGYNSDALHGDLSQGAREKIMKRFRDKSLQILVATDVAARGIDVDNITHVIHYRLPDDYEAYTHRSGRTARAGKKGVSIALINQKEGRRAKDLERMLKFKFEPKLIPSGDEVCVLKMHEMAEKLINTTSNDKLVNNYFDEFKEKFEDVTRDDLLKKLLTFQLDNLIRYYEKAQDLNVLSGSRDSGRSERGERGERGDRYEREDRGERRSSDRDGNYEKVYINLGSKDFDDKGSFFKYILEEGKMKKDEVGEIIFKESFSFIKLIPGKSKFLINALHNKPYGNRKIAIEPSVASEFGSRDRDRDDRGGRGERPERRNDRGDRGFDRGGSKFGGRGDRPRSFGGGSSERSGSGERRERRRRN